MIKKMVFLLASMILIFTSACSGSSSSDSSPDEGTGDESIVVVDWGGEATEAREEAFFEPFEKEYGVEVIVETPIDYGKFKAMVDSGNVTWDVVDADTFWAVQAGEDGLGEGIDYEIVEKDNVIPELANKYSMGAAIYSTIIAYSPEKISSESPKTWEDFWDTDKYPGARGLYRDPPDTLEIALLADGVSPEDLYPLDVDRAFESLDKLRSKTDIVWWESGAQPAELLLSGEVELSSAWNGRITAAISDGANLDLEYNQGILASQSWIIPKGSNNKELAMKFIDFVTSKEPQAKFSEIIDYSPVNKDSLELLDDETKKRLGESPELSESQFLRDEKFWADNYEELNQRFQEWILQ